MINGTDTVPLADIALLDVVELPLDSTGPDYGFECENRTILSGEWIRVRSAGIHEIIPFINFRNPVLHTSQKYTPVSSLQSLPFEKRRSLELVYTDKVDIIRSLREGGGNKWKASFSTRGGYLLSNITITDPELFDLLDNAIYPEGPCLITMSLSMPHEPEGWTGPRQPCWKLIAGIIELSLADQILIEMHLAGWSIQQGQTHCLTTYGKQSRSAMTDEEKTNFISYLKRINSIS